MDDEQRQEYYERMREQLRTSTGLWFSTPFATWTINAGPSVWQLLVRTKRTALRTAHARYLTLIDDDIKQTEKMSQHEAAAEKQAAEAKARAAAAAASRELELNKVRSLPPIPKRVASDSYQAPDEADPSFEPDNGGVERKPKRRRVRPAHDFKHKVRSRAGKQNCRRRAKAWCKRNQEYVKTLLQESTDNRELADSFLSILKTRSI
ncbi:unnamed protein product [Tilletia laevis]|uniref:Uncharacterized protein n=1 Tax=Tilletia laevis TaxID=157183 RepID=A0A9N8M8N6_9BASI|nr:unnamed protein product [Tilletia laevis]